MKKNLCLAFAAITLASCTVFQKEAKSIPPVKVDETIGKKMIERPKSAMAFNGDFDLGTAGWALKCYIGRGHAFKKDVVKLTAVPNPDGKGLCLKVNSIPKCNLYWLAGREVYLKKGAKIELSFKAKVKKFPGSANIKSFYLDFRNFNKYRHGMSTKERYWLNGVGLRNISEKWKTVRKILTMPRTGYYFFRFVIKSSDPEKPMPEIYIDSVKLTPKNDIAKSSKTFPQIAIYENKTIPAYDKNEEIKYLIKADFPNAIENKKELSLDMVDDQTLKPVLSKNVELVKNKNGVYEGQCSFKSRLYGSYSTRVRDAENSALDWFGGDYVVVRPPAKQSPDSIAKGIGINSVAHKMFPDLNDKFLFYVESNSMKNYYDILRISGVRNVRSWNFKWKCIEPEKGKFNFADTDKMVEEYKKRDIELIGVLGVDFGKEKAMKRKQNIPNWVLPLCKKHPVSKTHKLEAYVPPFDLWEDYCRALMSHYKKDIKTWEVFNEPNGWMTPENYLKYTKAAHRAARSVSPDIKVIGPCPTGDFAADRFAGWSKEFLALGGEKYIDGFAFHPYGASNDFQNGKFFEASNTVDSIRSWLKNKNMPLYNTECYHFPNSICLRTTQTDAATILRHYLINLGKGVKRNSSIASEQIYKYRMNPHVALNMCHNMESVPAPIGAALNNLSFLLKDMTKTKSIKLNKFINCYLFSGAENGSAVGAIWDLRPNGNQWTSGADPDSVTLLDMWGNKISSQPEGVHLGLNPIYLTGKKEDVEDYLSKSKFILSSPLKITGRFFKNDLYLNAKNMTGMSFAPEVEISSSKGLNMPKSVQFAFAGNSDCTAFLPGALKGKVSSAEAAFNVTAKNENIGSGKINFLPQNASYDLPFAGSKPLEIKLSDGSTAKFLAEKDCLSITVSVKDENIVKPKKYNPWTGDAVEIFIDPAPFASLKRDLIYGGENSLRMHQYVIPAKPSKDEKKYWTNNKSQYAPKIKTETTSNGYEVCIQIPWKAIKPGGNRYGIYGIDIEIDKLKTFGGKNKKASLGGKPGQSYKMRLHYPLFRAPEQAELYSGLEASGVEKLANGSFEKKKKDENEPKGWLKRWDRKGKTFKYGDFGYNGTKGVCVKLDEPSTKYVKAWPQKFKCNPDGKTKLLIEGFVKAENIRIAKPNPGGAGLKFFLHFYNDNKKKHMDNIGIGVRQNIVGSFGWKKIQCVIPVPRGATSCQLSCGLSKGVTGTVYFDDIHLKTIK